MKVLESATGQEALWALQTTPTINLIILDYQMPEMDGLTLASEVRRQMPEVSARMILLSSGGEIPEERLHGLDIAMTMTKPVRQSRLFDVVINALNPIRARPAPSPVQTETQEEISPEETQGRPILVVEDNRANQLLARRILEQVGYRVNFAEDGQMAVERLMNHHYDVVLMDIQMPVMDGFAATEAIRAWERERQKPRTPVLALTAHAIEGYREECLRHGMDDYITKPIKKRILLDAVAQWVDARPAILVVDDTPENRFLLRKILEKEFQAHLLFATNGHEAVEMVRRRIPAVVLLDMEMPVVDGYTAGGQIRALPGEAYARLPIFALTAHQGEEEIEKSLRAGCTGYLGKPIRRKQLVELIRPCLEAATSSIPPPAPET